MSIGRDTVTTLSSRAFVFALRMVQSIILARYLLPEGRGQYASLLLLPQILAFLAPLGIQWSSVYYLRLKTELKDALIQNSFGLTLVLGALACAITFGLEIALYDQLLKGLPALAIIIAALLVPIRVADGWSRGIFRGTNRIPIINMLTAARPILSLSGIVLVIVLLGAGVPGLVTVALLAEAAILLGAVWIIRRDTSLRPRLEKRVIGPMLSYGARLYLYSILIFLNWRIGMGLLRYFLDYVDVGYYVTAVTLAELIWAIPNALAFALFPRIAGSQPEMQTKLTSTACRITVAAVGAGCIVAAALAYPLIYLLYGREFLPAVTPLVALLPGIFVMSIQQILGQYVAARGYPGRVTVAAAVGILLNLALNIWWIPKLGIIGAALAATVSYALITILVTILYLRLSKSTLAEALLLKAQDWRDIVERIKRLRGRGS